MQRPVLCCFILTTDGLTVSTPAPTCVHLGFVRFLCYYCMPKEKERVRGGGGCVMVVCDIVNGVLLAVFLCFASRLGLFFTYLISVCLFIYVSLLTLHMASYQNFGRVCG